MALGWATDWSFRLKLQSVAQPKAVCRTGYLRSHTRDLYQIFVHVAYIWPWLGPPSRQGDEIPRGIGNFGGFPPIGNAL